MIIGWLQLIGGLAILIVGGEFLVRSSVKLALYLRVSAMVVGLTVVSFGTSFPELMVSLNAAIDGYADISIGNVVGSNIANLALVLGLTALIFPLSVKRSTVTTDWPAMLIVTILLIVLSLDGELETWEGGLFVLILLAYNLWVIRSARKELRAEALEDVDTDFKRSSADMIRATILLVVSIGALILGADLLVDGAVVVAEGFGVSERVIAVSIIAFGTSAPELATSLIAVYRKETAISIGNLIGSNLFNILGILGVTALVKPIGISYDVLHFDYYWVIGIPLLLYPILLTRMRVTRIEGALLFAAYVVYLFMVF